MASPHDLDERRRATDALNQRWIACPYCDALWPRPTLKEGERAQCGRCHSIILTNKRQSAERTIALMIASLILYAAAVSFPFMSMERSGLSNEISVIDAVGVLWASDMYVLAISCAAFILVFPLMRILLLLFVGVSLHHAHRTGTPHALSYRLAQAIEPWSMAEIFMIGVIVSLVKVGSLASLWMGPAFWALTGLMVLMALGASAVCRDTIWQDIRRVG